MQDPTAVRRRTNHEQGGFEKGVFEQCGQASSFAFSQAFSIYRPSIFEAFLRRRRPQNSLGGATWGPLGALRAAPWSLLAAPGAAWSVLGASDGSSEPLGGPLGDSRRPLGAPRSFFVPSGPLEGPGGFLGASGRRSERYWATKLEDARRLVKTNFLLHVARFQGLRAA